MLWYCYYTITSIHKSSINSINFIHVNLVYKKSKPQSPILAALANILQWTAVNSSDLFYFKKNINIIHNFTLLVVKWLIDSLVHVIGDTVCLDKLASAVSECIRALLRGAVLVLYYSSTAPTSPTSYQNTKTVHFMYCMGNIIMEREHIWCKLSS